MLRRVEVQLRNILLLEDIGYVFKAYSGVVLVSVQVLVEQSDCRVVLCVLQVLVGRLEPSKTARDELPRVRLLLRLHSCCLLGFGRESLVVDPGSLRLCDGQVGRLGVLFHELCSGLLDHWWRLHLNFDFLVQYPNCWHGCHVEI